MKQLIQQIAAKYNISEDDAAGIVDLVQNYSATNQTDNAPAEETTEKDQPATGTAVTPKNENIFQKAEYFVEDHISGGLKEKAEEVFGEIGDKVKGMFK